MEKLTVTLSAFEGMPNARLAKFSGDFDGAAKDDIVEVATDIETCGPSTTFIFEFSELNYLNSFAIGQMVGWHNTLNTKQGKIVVVAATKNVQDIFTVLGIANILTVYPTIEAAKADLA